MRPCAYLQEIQLVLLRDLPKTLPSFRQASQHQKTKCNFTKELWSRMPRIAARMEYFMAQAPERESQFIWSKFKKWKLMSWRNVFMYKLPMYHSLSWSTCEVDLRCHWKKTYRKQIQSYLFQFLLLLLLMLLWFGVPHNPITFRINPFSLWGHFTRK